WRTTKRLAAPTSELHAANGAVDSLARGHAGTPCQCSEGIFGFKLQGHEESCGEIGSPRQCAQSFQQARSDGEQPQSNVECGRDVTQQLGCRNRLRVTHVKDVERSID